MSSSPMVRRAVRQSLLAGLAVSVGGLSLMDATAQENPGASTTAMEEITVTGSRLRRERGFVEVSPVQTIGLDELQSSGSLTLDETLNKYPQLVPTNTAVTNQSGGVGVQAANLRNLGGTRTLTLVDGRRFIPGDVSGLTDMATVPDILVERVEIITGGASAVYGSDAIAGVVNFILRDDIEGADLRYQYGETSRSDGAFHKIDFVLGTNVADGRGNVVVHGGYTERERIFFPDRRFSSDSLLADRNGVLQPLRLNTMPGSSIALSPAQQAQIVGLDFAGAAAACSSPLTGIRFGENGVPAPLCLPTDGFNFVDLNYLQRPVKLWQITGLGRYDISDSVEAYTLLGYTDKNNAYQQAPDSFRPTSPGQETATTIIPNAATNPLFSPELRSFFAANQAFFDPNNTGLYTVRAIASRGLALGPRTFTADTKNFNVTAGLRGELAIGNDEWSWDSYFQYSKADVDVTDANRVSLGRLELGINTVQDGNGTLKCASGPLLGCVPVNFFGTNSLTPEMVRFLRVSAGREEELTRELAGASIAGDLFSLPAGAVASAFGVEWREESFESIPSEADQAGDVTPRAFRDPTSGSFDVFEIFAEARFPLLADIPGVQDLAIELAGRYSDYSTIGNVNTWKASLDWLIIDSVRFRGGYSRAIRAPNLNELFAQRTLGFDGGTRDPCTVGQNPSPQVKEFCVLQGVPANAIDDFIELEPGFFSLRGGNPALEEEEADTLTAGFVLTPLSNLTIALDYFDIEIDGAIAPVSAQLVVQNCFATLDLSNPTCQAINRLTSGRIDFVEASLLNVSTRRVRGTDLDVTYAMELPRYLALAGSGATLNLALIMTRLFEQSVEIAAGQPVLECAGYFGGPCSSDGVRITPDLSGLFRASWMSGPASLAVQVNYIGDLDLHPNSSALVIDSLSARAYVDINGSYDLGGGVRLIGGIQNALDKQPPVIGLSAGGDSNTNVETFDPLGRRFFLGVNVSF